MTNMHKSFEVGNSNSDGKPFSYEERCISADKVEKEHARIYRAKNYKCGNYEEF